MSAGMCHDVHILVLQPDSIPRYNFPCAVPSRDGIRRLNDFR